MQHPISFKRELIEEAIPIRQQQINIINTKLKIYFADELNLESKSRIQGTLKIGNDTVKKIYNYIKK